MLSLHVSRMSCGGCAASVEKAVKAVDQSAAVKIDIGARRVDIVSAIDAGKIVAAIKAAGYESTPL